MKEDTTLTIPKHEEYSAERFLTERRKFLAYLKTNIATCSMVCEELGIRQKNATRIKRDAELSGQLVELWKGPCEETGFRAWYLTTNPELVEAVNSGMPATMLDELIQRTGAKRS